MSNPILWSSIHATHMIRSQQLLNPLMLVMSPEVSTQLVGLRFSLVHCFTLVQDRSETQEKLQRLIFETGANIPRQHVLDIPQELLTEGPELISPLAEPEEDPANYVRFPNLLSVLVNATFLYADEEAITRHQSAQCVVNPSGFAVPCAECNLRLHAQVTLLGFINQAFNSVSEPEQQEKLRTTAQLIDFCVRNRPPYDPFSGALSPPDSRSHTPRPPRSGTQTPLEGPTFFSPIKA